jgi:hypothetical protein
LWFANQAEDAHAENAHPEDAHPEETTEPDSGVGKI